MDEIGFPVKRMVKMVCFILAAFALGWGFTAYKAVFLGLLLGGLVSLINAVYTAYKVRRFSARILAGLKPKGLGLATRLSVVALAVLLGVRFPETINVPALAAGLVLSPVILWANGIKDGVRLRKATLERGED